MYGAFVRMSGRPAVSVNPAAWYCPTIFDRTSGWSPGTSRLADQSVGSLLCASTVPEGNGRPVGQTTPAADVETPPPPPPLGDVVVVVRGDVVVRRVVEEVDGDVVREVVVVVEDPLRFFVVLPEVRVAGADVVRRPSAEVVPGAGAEEAAPAPRAAGEPTGDVAWLLQPARAVAQTTVHATTRAVAAEVVRRTGRRVTTAAA